MQRELFWELILGPPWLPLRSPLLLLLLLYRCGQRSCQGCALCLGPGLSVHDIRLPPEVWPPSVVIMGDLVVVGCKFQPLSLL